MFEKHLGKLVKVVYQDGDDVSVQKGDLVAVEDGFLTIVSLKTEYIIAISSVIKVEVDNERPR